MNLVIEKMKSIVAQCYSAAAATAFGTSGVQTLSRLVECITRLYKNIEPGSRKERIVVFMRVAPLSVPSAALQKLKKITEISTPERVNHELDNACVVEVKLNGELSVYEDTSADLTALSNEAIVYIWTSNVEHFLISGHLFVVENPLPTNASVFARPTFSTLSEALEDYRSRVVRNTSCFILEDAWDDKSRLFLRNKPEATMRRSLHQFLRTVFPDAEVRPEQVVDESHPVDIKVTWSDSNNRAIIEIKWLGQSRHENGELATKFTAARAVNGAKQLAEYLDADHTAGPGLRTRGYLVVFDARRQGITATTLSLSPAEGLHYRDQEIAYDPKYHDIRSDFAPPMRMFAEPVFS